MFARLTSLGIATIDWPPYQERSATGWTRPLPIKRIGFARVDGGWQKSKNGEKRLLPSSPKTSGCNNRLLAPLLMNTSSSFEARSPSTAEMLGPVF